MTETAQLSHYTLSAKAAQELVALLQEPGALPALQRDYLLALLQQRLVPVLEAAPTAKAAKTTKPE